MPALFYDFAAAFPSIEHRFFHSFFERLGWPVKVLDAGPANIKVTTPFDLIVAEAVLAQR